MLINDVDLVRSVLSYLIKFQNFYVGGVIIVTLKRPIVWWIISTEWSRVACLETNNDFDF